MIPVVIIGAGAAGVFAAIQARSLNPNQPVILLEKSKMPLAKVKISGGGRCNVTHACFEPAELVKNYPRGALALRGPFSRFQPKDTVEWFKERNIALKTEKDGRMFPITNSSQTIIDCLLQEAKKVGVDLRLETGVQSIEKSNDGFLVHLFDQTSLVCKKLLIATGSTRTTFSWLEALGHSIVKLVPSLFTFNVAETGLKELSGVSVPYAHVRILGSPFEQRGPLLITHWGFSGPAVLKLSSFGARFLHEKNYKATICINWLGSYSEQEIKQILDSAKIDASKRQVANFCPFELPTSLWLALLQRASIDERKRYAELSKLELTKIVTQIAKDSYDIAGQTTYKEEFVTAGGIELDEVNFKTMESKIVKNLYFAGEILDVDGITGGFNFQNAWTTGWIAGHSLAHAPSDTASPSS
jgi:predicted Rossmann fold flavoprotein